MYLVEEEKLSTIYRTTHTHKVECREQNKNGKFILTKLHKKAHSPILPSLRVHFFNVVFFLFSRSSSTTGWMNFPNHYNCVHVSGKDLSKQSSSEIEEKSAEEQERKMTMTDDGWLARRGSSELWVEKCGKLESSSSSFCHIRTSSKKE